MIATGRTDRRFDRTGLWVTLGAPTGMASSVKPFHFRAELGTFPNSKKYYNFEVFRLH